MSNEKIIGKNISAEKAVKQAGLSLGDQGKVSHETYHHEELMDQMIKTIEFTPMDKKMRAVLLLRLIHGFTIQRMQIHLFLKGHLTGNSFDELTAIEAEGKRRMHETLKNHSMEEIVKTINAKPGLITSLRNEMTNPNLGLS